MAIQLLLVIIVTILHVLIIAMYTLFKTMELQNKQNRFLRSFTNLMVLENPKSYAVLKKMSPKEIVANHFESAE